MLLISTGGLYAFWEMRLTNTQVLIVVSKQCRSAKLPPASAPPKSHRRVPSSLGVRLAPCLAEGGFDLQQTCDTFDLKS